MKNSNSITDNHLKENPYAVPPLYFEKLADAVMEKIISEKYSIESSPFSIPDHYFEKLPSEINSAISEHESRVIAWRRPAFYIPATVAALLLLFFLFYNDTPEMDFKTLTVSDIENSFYLETIDAGMIADMLEIPDEIILTEEEQYLLDNNPELILNDNL